MSSTGAFIEEPPRSFNNVWKPIIYEHILYCPTTALYFWEVVDQSRLLKRFSKLNTIKIVPKANELQHILVEKQPKFSILYKIEGGNKEGPSYVLLNALYEINESKSLNFEWHLKRMTWVEYQVNIFQSILLMMVNQVDQMICLREELIKRESQLAQYKKNETKTVTKTETKTETKTKDNRNRKSSRHFSFDTFDPFFFKRNQCASGILYISHYFISPQITIKQIKRNPDYTNEVPFGEHQTQAVMQLAMALKVLGRYERSLYQRKNKMSLKPTNKCTGGIPCNITGLPGFFESPSDHHHYSMNLFGLDCNCRCLVCPSLRDGLLKDGSNFVDKRSRHTCDCQCAKCIIWRKELAKKEVDGYVSEIEDFNSNLEPGSVSNLEQQDWSYELAVMYSSKNSRDSPEVTMARQRIAANKQMIMETANNEASYQDMQMKKYNKTINKQLNTDLPLQVENNLKIERYYDKLMKCLPTEDQKISTKSDNHVLEKEKCNHSTLNNPMVSLDSLATSTSSKITKKLNQKPPENAQPIQELSLNKDSQKSVKQDSSVKFNTSDIMLNSFEENSKATKKFDKI